MKDFIKQYYKPILALIASLTLVVGLGSASAIKTSVAPVLGATGQLMGSGMPGQWFVVDKFTGYKTKADPSKIDDGSSPTGQNTIINDGDRISIRDYGYTVVGDATTTGSYVTSLHTFRLRNGENILMRAQSTSLQYLEEGNDTWETLNATYTASQIFGFADFNINADLTSYVYFGNAVEPFSRWTGAHTLITTAVAIGDSSVKAADTSFFSATGTLVICGTKLDYTSKTLTAFSLTGTSTVACALDRSVAQAPEEFSSNPRGNIYLTANNRLFVAGRTSTPQAVFFSKYTDATTFANGIVTESTADAAGVFNLGEGGGGVTGMVLDENSIYILKKSIIYKATLSDSVYTLTPLKNFDGKSQTTGSIFPRSVFTGGNGTFYVTPDRQIMNLARVANIDYPQIVPISDAIKPTADIVSYASSSGIFWRDSAYFSVRSNQSQVNDTILVYNFKMQTWENPVIGLNASDFTIYDDGNGEALYFGDAITPNVYKITADAVDNSLGVTANYRTKRFDFGLPVQQKLINNVFVSGYITPNTTLNISMLLNYNGFTQIYTASVKGTESKYLYNIIPYNVFGLSVFGYLEFGSSQQSDEVPFKLYLVNGLREVPIYDVQLEFESDGVSQDWSILNYGFKWRLAPQDENGGLYRGWN